MEKLEEEMKSGGFTKYTKKEALLKEKEIVSLRQKYDGIRKMTKMPDAMFVTSLKECTLPIKEAKMRNIVTMGIVNTDSDPKQLKYPIPANDNARKSVRLILETIADRLKDVKRISVASDKDGAEVQKKNV